MSWLLHWKYSDGSGCDVLPTVFTDEQKEMIERVLQELETVKTWDWVEVK